MFPVVEDWSRWYKKGQMGAHERCFQELAGSIPAYVKNVIDFGCAGGRNLAFFDGKYKLYGVDLVPESKMEWPLPFKDLTYIRGRLQDFKLEPRMDDFLCISHGTIMYLSESEQRRFLGYLIDRGCKNFIVQEYDAATCIQDGYYSPTLLNRLRRRRIGYPFSNPFDFEKRWYRAAIPAWVRIDAKSA